MRRLYTVVFVGATVVALAFLLVPVAALFLQTSPAQLIDELGHNVAKDALIVSLKTSLIAHALVLLTDCAEHVVPVRPVVLALLREPGQQRSGGRVASKPAGNWNTYVIEATTARIRVTLNGELVTDYATDGSRPSSGHIGLQNHTGKVQFRPAGKRHIMSGKKSKRRRQMRRWRSFDGNHDAKGVRIMLQK